MTKHRTVHDCLRDHLLTKCGYTEAENLRKVYGTANISKLFTTQWSAEFEQLMRNRLVMGALRYGVMGSDGKPQYDRLSSVLKRLDQYRLTGNTELLVDCANLLLLEFVEGDHPLRHFKALDVDNVAQHVSVRKEKE